MNKLLDELSQKAEDYADDTDLPWPRSLHMSNPKQMMIVSGIDDTVNDGRIYL